jgi:hypothetical protein
MRYVKPETLSLLRHPELNEAWVQERIAEDPSLLGLGDIVLKDKERIHPGAGRLDLLCQETDGNRRYEIEIQLGPTDESHIIRTLEYWDIERKRYPQYDHVAVIVAEDITSRFLNVISLFNGHLPLVAIRLQAIVLGDGVSLLFTTVLDEMRLGLIDEDEETYEVTDRSYWEKRGSRSTMEMADNLLRVLQVIDPTLSFKYNKYYIGLARNGRPDNFVVFRPKKDWLKADIKLARSEELQARLDEASLDLLDYDSRYGAYRIRLSRNDLPKHESILQELFQRAYAQATK